MPRGDFSLAICAHLRVGRIRTNKLPHSCKRRDGALAQLVERFAGSEEVRGSTPLGSTITFGKYTPLLRFLHLLANA